jgi:hypothetical protein
MAIGGPFGVLGATEAGIDSFLLDAEQDTYPWDAHELDLVSHLANGSFRDLDAKTLRLAIDPKIVGNVVLVLDGNRNRIGINQPR